MTSWASLKSECLARDLRLMARFAVRLPLNGPLIYGAIDYGSCHAASDPIDRHYLIPCLNGPMAIRFLVEITTSSSKMR